MSNKLKNSGFSLTEVLLAVGTLSIGMIFIGGTFLAGVYFSTIATERTIASVASDEAFAKVRLYGVNFNSTLWQVAEPNTFCVDFNEVSLVKIDPNKYAYPSLRTGLDETQYFWSALCRPTEDDVSNAPPVQVTVFVSRKAGSGMKYRSPADPLNRTVDYPMPVPVEVSGTTGNNTLAIQESDKITWINDGCTIVDNENGRIYRVLERYPPPNDSIILLDGSWDVGFVSPDVVWVVPPAAGSGKYPCIAVYQRVIEF